jgi:Phage integrase family
MALPKPVTGRPYHASPNQWDYIRPAGREQGLGDRGWHTFRHTYRVWLNATGAPVGVQQKLMRHADVRTTMNIYGGTFMQSKRDAHSMVVRVALRPALKEARHANITHIPQSKGLSALDAVKAISLQNLILPRVYFRPLSGEDSLD